MGEMEDSDESAFTARASSARDHKEDRNWNNFMESTEGSNSIVMEQVVAETKYELSSTCEKTKQQLADVSQQTLRGIYNTFPSASSNLDDSNDPPVDVDDLFVDIRVEFIVFCNALRAIVKEYIHQSESDLGNVHRYIRQLYRVSPKQRAIKRSKLTVEELKFLLISLLLIFIVIIGVYPEYHIMIFPYLLSKLIFLVPVLFVFSFCFELIFKVCDWMYSIFSK